MCDIGGIKNADVSKNKKEKRNQNPLQLNPMMKENHRYVVITYIWVEFISAKEADRLTCELINGVKNIGKTLGEKISSYIFLGKTLGEKNIIIYLPFVLNAEISSRWNALGNVKKETSIY